MLLRKLNPCRVIGSRRLSSLRLCVVLGLALAACTSQAPTGSDNAARAALETTKTEECSYVGIMACKATSLLSGNGTTDRQSVCFVSQSSSGSRTETCGSVESKAVAGNVSVRLGWSDNSNNETGFVIERCDQLELGSVGEKKKPACNGGWKTLGRVNANVTTYIDNSAAAKHTYLYRVKAVNDAGTSSYTDEALITAPAK